MEALDTKEKSREENLSEMLYIYPDNSDSTSTQSGGSFTTTIDKTTKAIKLHSIKTKPKKDPAKRNDKEYQAWLKQKEFTPFMDQVWLLLAKAEFQEGDYLRAISTFLYITKIYSSQPDIVTECNLWIARAYTEMGWLYEAGNILYKQELAGISPKHKKLHASIKANFLIRNNELEAAIPYLEDAIKKEKGISKTRIQYLLGQVYAKLGQENKAVKAFGAIGGMNTPYNYTFNAKLQKIQAKKSNRRESLSELNKMSKNAKNKEYLDQVFYAIGNIYLNEGDTAKAIQNYKLAVEKSTRNAFDKAICQIQLGDIYFNQRNFIAAQPCYSEAQSQIKKSHPEYKKVAFRSQVLDELVIHAKTVQEQDSLQHLAQLPENERLQIINKKIEQLKKEEEKRQKEEERQNRVENIDKEFSWGDLDKESNSSEITKQPQMPPQFGQPNMSSKFYFYNPQTVNQGRIAFQQQWGNRKLEDDWRRRNKTTTSFDGEGSDIEDNSRELIAEDQQDERVTQTITDDVYSVEYYLQQLPLTEEAIKASDDLIENGLFNMGLVYKNKLEDLDLAIEAFNTDIRRFPNTPNLEEIYYQLLLIYMQKTDQSMMANYRNRLLTEFPEGKYAVPLSDENYEWNFRHMAALQDSIYQATYNAYLHADVKTVRSNFESINKKYPFTDLMPKFALLNALSYAQTRDIKNLGENLTKLTEKYPKADVAPLATDILARIKEGKIILSDGSPISEFDWSRAYLGSNALDEEDGQLLQYSDSTDTPYLLLMLFKPNSIDRNELLYQIADYNFSNYVIQTFDLSYENTSKFNILQLRGFKSFTNIKSYLDKAFAEGSLMSQLDSSILVLPISIENYTKVLPKLGLENYLEFFKNQYQELLPSLISSWNIDEVSPALEEANEKENNADEPIIKKKPYIHAEEAVLISPDQEQKAEQPRHKQTTNTNEISTNDLLTDDQKAAVGKANDALKSVEDIMNNPVEGIKNIFKQHKDKTKLSKEEREELREYKKKEKLRMQELKAMEKARQDSIKKIEKAKTDSLSAVEKATHASIEAAKKEDLERKKLEEKNKREHAKAVAKEKEDSRKRKIEERKEKERLQKQKIKEREKQRKKLEKEKERRRKEKEKESNKKQDF